MNFHENKWWIVGGLVVLFLCLLGVYWWFFWADVAPLEERALPEEEVDVYLYHLPEYRLEVVRRLVPEAENTSRRVRQIVEKLAESPEEENLVSLMPEGLELRSVYLDEQVVYLDFNDQIIGAAEGSSGEMMFLYSIVNSVLANLPDEYKLVHFLVEGEMRKTIGPYGEESGHIAIQYPLGPRWDLTEKP